MLATVGPSSLLNKCYGVLCTGEKSADPQSPAYVPSIFGVREDAGTVRYSGKSDMKLCDVERREELNREEKMTRNVQPELFFDSVQLRK